MNNVSVFSPVSDNLNDLINNGLSSNILVDNTTIPSVDGCSNHISNDVVVPILEETSDPLPADKKVSDPIDIPTIGVDNPSAENGFASQQSVSGQTVPIITYGSMEELLFGADLDIEGITQDNVARKINIVMRSKRNVVPCPCCGEPCVRDGGGFERTITDMPYIPGFSTVIEFHGLKCTCRNPECTSYNQGFREPVPFAEKGAHTSIRAILTAMILTIMMSYSSSSAVLDIWGLPISHDTLRNGYHNPSMICLADRPEITVIGIDDIAKATGNSYYTGIYDGTEGGDRAMLALIDGRDGKGLREWLSRHPNVRMVMRDRDSAYAHVVNEVCGELCIQVADRFHLIKNEIDQLQDKCYASLPIAVAIDTNGSTAQILDKTPSKLVTVNPTMTAEELKGLHYDNSPLIGEDGLPIQVDARIAQSEKQVRTCEENRRKKHDKVVEVRTAYLNLDMDQIPHRKNATKASIIAKEFDLSSQTVNNYVQMTEQEVESLLDVRPAAPRVTGIDNYKNIIFRMAADDMSVDNIVAYVKLQGCQLADLTIVTHTLAVIGHHFPLRKERPFGSYVRAAHYPEGILVFSRNDIFRELVVVHDEKKNQELEKHLPLIKGKYPICTEIQEHFKEFHDAIMGDSTDAIDAFIEKHLNDEYAGFARRLKQDIGPIHNAILYPQSSGFVEGNNCKFKCLKRVLYGRSGTHNLEIRCRLAFLFCKESFDPWQVFPWLKKAAFLTAA